MLRFPEIDPIIFSIGPFELFGQTFEPAVRWYGVMYLIGFVAAMYILNRMAAKPDSKWTKEQVSDLLFYCFMGVIVGGRVGYVLFYNFGAFIDNPMYLFAITDGGMSFHGGLLGVISAFFYIAYTQKRTFFEVADVVAPTVPIGLGAGRLGNFINGELWGRTTDVPWGMVFPGAGELARHPSQLYQFALEGVALFAIMAWYGRKPRARGAMSGLFLVGYGAFRIVVEFVREPDAHLGLYAGLFTMGQMLSVPMIAFGAYLMMRKPSNKEA
ncbi:prolipoprotein diacylglyceryl transferase [Paraferrimonas sedimenticola]|uniref:Phosphatidylglycerol--prolipoprotein diacylglyceryl transferase n=1 Tax=Paraferrimonas sedimenticola TaxID=375674 RepID=A0AA37RXK1_9GAMM|nr:prolipoprotein diacylglyceryl transferase [Paraferrimonas sedimenticola]GLP97203.1 prolipoprotein diacylglyceryl transferase [Paraferrimonas sedimenticola]